MIEGGEDPLFIARRLVIFASEDVGLADSRGLNLALAAYNACEKIGDVELLNILGDIMINFFYSFFKCIFFIIILT